MNVEVAFIEYYISLYMKRVIIWLILVLPLCITACSKISGENGSANQSEYYVRYASDGLGGSGINVYNVSYTDEKGEQKSLSNMTADSFERTIGPVSVGFKASFRISVANTNDTRARAARIEVKKDNNPFVVKAENASTKGGVTVTYTIE